MIPSWARKGAKVVLVSDDWCVPAAHGERYPFKGNIYTIREVFFDGPHPSLRLEEVVNPVRLLRNSYGLTERAECAFAVERFRPVVEDKTDNEIEAQIYRKKVHQNGAPVKELERT